MADDISEKKATFRIDSGKENPLSADTVRAICAFRDERNWRPFYNLKDLALSLNLEAAELLECFQWTGREEDRPEEREHMAEELADVLIYAVLFADRAGFSLDEIVKRKLIKNLEKYPLPEEPSQSDQAVAEESAASEEAKTTYNNEPKLPLSLAEVEAWIKSLEAEEPVGEWTADPEGRFTYVKYSPRTLVLWDALKEVKLTTSETPEEVMALFSESTAGASVATLIERLTRMVRLERMRDGIFLEAQTRGVLLRVFKALRAVL